MKSVFENGKYDVIKTMALTSVIGHCKHHDIIEAIPLFEHKLCVNSLFACECDRHDNFSTSNGEK